MQWPQIAMIALYASSLAITAAQHGKPREGNHNFFTHVVAACIGITILYFGEFWN